MLKRFNSAEEYTEHWFKSTGYTVRSVKKEGITFQDLVLHYVKDFEDNATKAYKKLPIKLLEYAFAIHVRDNQRKEFEGVLDHLKTAHEDLTPLKKWVKAVTGKESPADVAVMAHWLWQIKRRAYEQPVVFHIMPVLFGAQGGGKTEAIKRLISPVSEYTLSMSMDMLSDSRNYEGLAYNYVVFFDELQGAHKADLNALKKQITTEHNSFRRMYTTTSMDVPQRCSFIGATNKRLSENFSDSTGMRRFWEVISSEVLDWQTINSIDYLELYKGIDEHRPRGYMTEDVVELLKRTQQAMVIQDEIDAFIEHYALNVGKELQQITAKELFNIYTVWEANQNYRNRLNSQQFGIRMRNRFQSTISYPNGAKQRIYLVNSASPIFTENQPLKVVTGGKK